MKNRQCDCEPGEWCIECLFNDGLDDTEIAGIADPPKCPDCQGKGGILLFNLWHDCDTCGGSGY